MLKKAFHHLEEIIGSSLLILMCLTATLQAGSRFLSKVYPDIKPIFWTEETCIILFIWFAFIGASLALKTGDHFAVEIICQKMPFRFRSILTLISALLLLSFSVLLIWFGFEFARNGLKSITPSLQIPKSFAYAAVPVGGFMMLMRTMEIFKKVMVSIKNKEDQS